MIVNVIKKAKQLFYDNKNSGLDVSNVQDAIDDLTQAIVDVDAVNESTGSPILLTDIAEGVVTGFKAYGRSTQDGEPTPDSPIEIKSVADSGYFDGELLQGAYAGATGTWTSNSNYVCSRNIIPCKVNDLIKLEHEGTTSQLMILFYDSNKNFISFVQTQSSNVLETTAVANACYFNFNIANPNGIALATAKHITVTINGKYALIVKSKGKNLFVGLKGWYNINSNGVFTQSNGWLSTDYIACKPLENYTISLVENGSVGMWCFYNKNKDLLSSLASTNKQTITIPQDCCYFTQYTYGTNTDIQIEYGDKVTEYEPYKETVSYIPLNEPLRSSLDGSVTDEVNLTEVNRRFAEVVLDGSEDEGWKISATDLYSSAIANLIKKPTSTSGNANALCDKFICYSPLSFNTEKNKGNACMNIGTNGNVVFFKNDITNVDEWKAWLQANPIIVQYELAEPITETIEPVDIVTYDNVTYISNANNADMWVEYYSNSSVGQRLAKTDEEVKKLKSQITDNAKISEIEESVKDLQSQIEGVSQIASAARDTAEDNVLAITNLNREMNSVKDNQLVKSVYTDTMGYITAKINGQVLELTATSRTLAQLQTALTSLHNAGYSPNSYVTAACRYGTSESPNNIGLLELRGTAYWLYDILTSDVLTNADYKVTFNATWIVTEKSVG